MKYIKIKVQWIYLYRTINSTGITFDFHLSKTRISKAAKTFPRKACSIKYNSIRSLYALLSFCTRTFFFALFFEICFFFFWSS
ncbi:hypothetical protein COE65_18015 [Bacillus sp. AFS051223]|uniref:DDE-type integrase/transposase/recombinase n=1 Tax=Bacillus sp. AFS051223 TaxID=2034280 RepID=UPI000BF839DA|nr:DDE-type integrase/transposase/recombinase [Bacillus sp. AFS051223]PFU20545.1 hypothetical protein COK80_29115 [Bacillus anthracis]PHA08596.1 hypothetical protein COE65_18015 [Bacillus sp. AFS051223]